MSKTVQLFLNGQLPTQKTIISKYYDYIACTDGSYHSVYEQYQIIPDFIIGDFDSLNMDELSSHKNTIDLIHTPDQNKTDFEKSLLYLSRHLDCVNFDIYGATGKEIDHFLGNIAIAKQYASSLNLYFYDDHSEFYFLTSPFKIDGCFHKTISFLPFDSATNLTVDGLLYPLESVDLHFPQQMSLRNKATKPTIKGQFQSGNLLVVIARN